MAEPLTELIRFVFQILGALLMLIVCIISFYHARKGRDVAGVTFGVSFFVMFVSRLVLIVIYLVTGLKNIAGSHVNEYVWWYVSLSTIPFAIGCFSSIFASGKVSSTVVTPLVLLAGIGCGLPFIEKIVPVIMPFAQFGAFVWLIAAVFLFATAMMYYFYNYKANDRYRLWMGHGFLLMALSSALSIFSGSTGVIYLLSMLTQFVGLFIVFYEIQFA